MEVVRRPKVIQLVATALNGLAEDAAPDRIVPWRFDR